MPKGPSASNESAPNPQFQQKKKYSAPQFTCLTPTEAKAKLKAAETGDPAVKQSLERIAHLEVRKRDQE